MSRRTKVRPQKWGTGLDVVRFRRHVRRTAYDMALAIAIGRWLGTQHPRYQAQMRKVMRRVKHLQSSTRGMNPKRVLRRFCPHCTTFHMVFAGMPPECPSCGRGVSVPLVDALSSYLDARAS